MKRKIITNTFGVMHNKFFLKAIQEMNETEWRLNEDVIALIEKRQAEALFLHQLKEAGKATEGQLSKLNKLLENDKDWFHFTIREVDTSKSWMFTEYDSSVGFCYIEKVNEELNLYKTVFK